MNMTQDEILDLCIRAAEVMGWERVYDWEALEDRNKDTFIVSENLCIVGPDGYDLWQPNNDLNQACALATALGINFESPHNYINLELDSEGWTASIRCGEGFDDYVIVQAESPALALTLAALKAHNFLKIKGTP